MHDSCQMIKFEWFLFAETVVWKFRQTWSPNQKRWGTAAPAAAWMKPAVAAAPSALKVLAVVRAHAPPPAAAHSTIITAAHRPPGQRNPPLHGARRAKGSCGKEPAAAAAKEKLKLTRHVEIWMLSYWSSAALTPPSLIRHLSVAACPQWLTRTVATSHQSWAAQTLRPHGQLIHPARPQWTITPPLPPLPPSTTSPSHPCLRWSTTVWSIIHRRVATRPSPTASYRHLRLLHQKREAAGRFCTSVRRVEAMLQIPRWRGMRK